MSEDKLRLAEFRVRPMTVYQVTTFIERGDKSWSRQYGQFGNFESAYEVAQAMAKAFHASTGYPQDDKRIVYPKLPD